MNTKIIKLKDLTADSLLELIKNKESFSIIEIDKMKMLQKTVYSIEAAIEKEKLKCKIYTEHRSTVAGAGATAYVMPHVMIAGLASLALIAVHNHLTRYPDYDVCKNIILKQIHVNYKKDINNDR